MQRKVTAASFLLPSDPRAHLSVVQTSRVDFHKYFTRFKGGDGFFHDTHIMEQGFVLLFALVL